MDSIVAVVLAAGKGTRMKSALPKAAHRLCGKPLARFAVDLTRGVGAARVIMVVGHGADAVQNAVGEDVEYVLQEPQLGTGHAVQQAAPLLRDFTGTVLVINGDVPLVPQETLAALLARHRETGAAATLLSAVLDDPASYGRIVRRPDGAVARIVERKDATPEIAALREVNAGVYCFAAPELFRAVFGLDRNNQQGELYLTDVIEQLAAEGKRVEACVTEDPLVMQGVNDRVELAQAAAILRERINRRWMLEGVTLIDPAATYIDADVEIGPDTLIYPMTFLEGRTRVGAGCQLGPGARIVDTTLGNGVTVQSSLVVEAEIGDETRIGPFANLRPGCRLGRGVKVGDFVELKNATIGDRTSLAHLSYIGDAEVGERVNIGASVVTVNYDGRRKSRTQIGAGAFVGCHATLIAPVTVGENAYVAAASPVTEDVPPDALAIARSRQTNKEGWAARRRQGG
jgi:bifunctional UDP-N-acetylglucosamine pyrophosphorylase / glucosamine-1-phosphate N-acetyltransferase